MLLCRRIIEVAAAASTLLTLLIPGVGPGQCQIRAVDFLIWQKINLLLLERREHK